MPWLSAARVPPQPPFVTITSTRGSSAAYGRNPATRTFAGTGNGSVSRPGTPVATTTTHVAVGESLDGRTDEVVGVDVLRALRDVHDRAAVEVAPPLRQRRPAAESVGDSSDEVQVVWPTAAIEIEQGRPAREHELPREHDLLERERRRRRARRPRGRGRAAP